MQGQNRICSHFVSQWLPAMAAFIVLVILGVFGVGVFAAKSTPTTTEDSATVTVDYVGDAGEVAMASTEPIFTSEELSFEDFNAVALQWEGARPDLVTMELRIKGDGDWSGWQRPLSMADESKNDSDLAPFSTMLINGNGDKVQFRIYTKANEERVPEIQNVKVITINSEAPIHDGFVKMTSTVDAQSLDVITRSQWGANENYRFDGDDELWPVTKVEWEKYIVHHTAGSNGGSDPAATIRAIYYYHAVSLGWGDIGYNFLIDPAGRIYQGRYGGDDVIGGHAYDEATSTSYNVGTLGASVLGCYDTGGACGVANSFNNDQLTAL